MPRPPDIAYTGDIPVCWSDRQLGKRGSARCHIQGYGLRNDVGNHSWKYPYTLCGIPIPADGWFFEVYGPEDHDTISCRRCRKVWHRIHREQAEADFTRAG